MNYRYLMFIALFIGAPLVSVAVSTAQAADQASYTCLICHADCLARKIRHHDCGGTLCGDCYARTLTMASGRAGMCPSCQQPPVQEEDAAMRQAIAESIRSYEQEAPARQVAQAEDAALARREEDLARVGPQKPLRGLVEKLYDQTTTQLEKALAAHRQQVAARASKETPAQFRGRIAQLREEALARALARNPRATVEDVYRVPVVGATHAMADLEDLLLSTSWQELLKRDQGVLSQSIQRLLERVECSGTRAISRMPELLIKALKNVTQELQERGTMKLWWVVVMLIKQCKGTVQSHPQYESAHDGFVQALRTAGKDAGTISDCVMTLLQCDQ
ncbi:hypothetical protein EBZ39_09825 [bacterium]|nr:hypothetical protein [bacterium]